MNTSFKFLTPGDRNNWTKISPIFEVSELIAREAAFKAVSLADSAADFFRGRFPFSTPYFAIDSIHLPWHDHYHRSSADGAIVPVGCISAEVARIAARLDEVCSEDSGSPCSQSMTYLSQALNESPKVALQGLAVETMLLAERCIDLLSEDQAVKAFPWLIAAYERIIDCTCSAQEIVDQANKTRNQSTLVKLQEIAPISPRSLN